MGDLVHLGKKVISKAIGRNRQTLSISHLSGKVTSSGDNRHLEADEFANRMLRIKKSLDRINDLMEQVKNRPVPGDENGHSRRED